MVKKIKNKAKRTDKRLICSSSNQPKWHHSSCTEVAVAFHGCILANNGNYLYKI